MIRSHRRRNCSHRPGNCRTKRKNGVAYGSAFASHVTRPVVQGTCGPNLQCGGERFRAARSSRSFLTRPKMNVTLNGILQGRGRRHVTPSAVPSCTNASAALLQETDIRMMDNAQSSLPSELEFPPPLLSSDSLPSGRKFPMLLKFRCSSIREVSSEVSRSGLL